MFCSFQCILSDSRLSSSLNKNINFFVFIFLGDPAVGEGVNRFLFSMITQKLKCGFHLNFGMSLFLPFLNMMCQNIVSFSV